MNNHNLQSHYPAPSHTVAMILIVLISALLGYVIVTMNSSLHADEGFHAGQIWLFYDGQNKLAGNITVPPTYHFIIGKIVQFTGGYHDNLLRLISLGFALLTVPVVYFAARVYCGADAWIKTLQVYFTPLIFPYFFVLYTDIWSLCGVALTLLLTLQRHYLWAGLAGALSVLIRQDNVAWIGLIYLYVCFDSITAIDKKNAVQLFKNALFKGAVFNVVFIGFLIFVYINGGVAIGDAAAHKMSAFNLSNLHVFLICTWVLFLPTHITQIPKILPLLHKPITLLLLAIGFVLYVGTLKNTHPYNTIMYDYFVHNGLMHLLTDFPIIKALSYLLAAWTFLSLLTIELPDWRWRWLIFIAPLAAISHPLVEPRYYIPAFFLIQILRPKLSREIEFFTLALYVAISAYILYGTTKELIFL